MNCDIVDTDVYTVSLLLRLLLTLPDFSFFFNWTFFPRSSRLGSVLQNELLVTDGAALFAGRIPFRPPTNSVTALKRLVKCIFVFKKNSKYGTSGYKVALHDSVLFR